MRASEPVTNVTVTLPKGDWTVLLAGLWKLPMEQAYLPLTRLQTALNEAQQKEIFAGLVKGPGNGEDSLEGDVP